MRMVSSENECGGAKRGICWNELEGLEPQTIPNPRCRAPSQGCAPVCRSEGVGIGIVDMDISLGMGRDRHFDPMGRCAL